MVTTSNLPDSNSGFYWVGDQNRPDVSELWYNATDLGVTNDTPNLPFSNDWWSVTISPLGSVSLYQDPNGVGTPYRTLSLDTSKPWYWGVFLNDATSATFPAGNDSVTLTSFSAVPTPEPATLTLLGSALLGLGVIYLRRRRAKA
jgi:hypothetical protein